MDTISNMRIFLLVARSESFSFAARELKIAPSIVSNRIKQLEEQLGGRLFERTTHHVRLTEFGQQCLTKTQRIISSFDELLANSDSGADEISGLVRVKIPNSLLPLGFGDMFADFRARHSALELQIMVMDRKVNPIDEGFDIALNVGGPAFDGVVDEPLFSYPRILVATPEYLARNGTPSEPKDLEQHDIFNLVHNSGTLSFYNDGIPIQLKFPTNFSSNSIHVLAAAAKRGHGIAVVSRSVCAAELDQGTLVQVLADHMFSELWVSAQVPMDRLAVPRVQAVLEFLRAQSADMKDR